SGNHSAWANRWTPTITWNCCASIQPGIDPAATPQPIAPFLVCPLAHDAEYDRTGTPARMDRIVQSMHWPLIIGLLSSGAYIRLCARRKADSMPRVYRAGPNHPPLSPKQKKPEYIFRFSLARQSHRLSAATLSYNCTIPIVIT